MEALQTFADLGASGIVAYVALRFAQVYSKLSQEMGRMAQAISELNHSVEKLNNRFGVDNV